MLPRKSCFWAIGFIGYESDTHSGICVVIIYKCGCPLIPFFNLLTDKLIMAILDLTKGQLDDYLYGYENDIHCRTEDSLASHYSFGGGRRALCGHPAQ